MNWRAIGCGGLAAALFLLLGVVGIWRALGPAACPDSFQVASGGYEATGEPGDEPRITGTAEAPVPGGEIGLGFARWPLWVAPGEVPAPDGDELPERLVFACPDGTYQEYVEAGS